MLVDYPYIRAYGKMPIMNFSDAKIAEEIAKAQKADAPTDVVRLMPNGNWTRLNHYDDRWQKMITDQLDK